METTKIECICCKGQKGESTKFDLTGLRVHLANAHFDNVTMYRCPVCHEDCITFTQSVLHMESCAISLQDLSLAISSSIEQHLMKLTALENAERNSLQAYLDGLNQNKISKILGLFSSTPQNSSNPSRAVPSPSEVTLPDPFGCHNNASIDTGNVQKIEKADSDAMELDNGSPPGATSPISIKGDMDSTCSGNRSRWDIRGEDSKDLITGPDMKLQLPAPQLIVPPTPTSVEIRHLLNKVEQAKEMQKVEDERRATIFRMRAENAIRDMYSFGTSKRKPLLETPRLNFGIPMQFDPTPPPAPWQRRPIRFFTATPSTQHHGILMNNGTTKSTTEIARSRYAFFDDSLLEPGIGENMNKTDENQALNEHVNERPASPVEGLMDSSGHVDSLEDLIIVDETEEDEELFEPVSPPHSNKSRPATPRATNSSSEEVVIKRPAKMTTKVHEKEDSHKKKTTKAKKSKEPAKVEESKNVRKRPPGLPIMPSIAKLPRIPKLNREKKEQEKTEKSDGNSGDGKTKPIAAIPAPTTVRKAGCYKLKPVEISVTPHRVATIGKMFITPCQTTTAEEFPSQSPELKKLLAERTKSKNNQVEKSSSPKPASPATQEPSKSKPFRPVKMEPIDHDFPTQPVLRTIKSEPVDN